MRCKPFAQLVEEIISLVEDEAVRLGCLDEVRHARQILERGTSADRQLAVLEQARANGANEREAGCAVVDWLIEETVTGLTDGAATPEDKE
jgi:carboxylate-amine ligase